MAIADMTGYPFLLPVISYAAARIRAIILPAFYG